MAFAFLKTLEQIKIAKPTLRIKYLWKETSKGKVETEAQ